MTTILPSVPLVIPPDAGTRADLGGVGFHWKIDGLLSGGRLSVVHNLIAPRTLVAPLHLHHREDEYTFVLSGTLGTLLGDDVVSAEQGTWVFKPRAQWHTLWNRGDSPCEIIEVISPAGFENYFREITTIGRNVMKLIEINQKYELEMDFMSIQSLLPLRLDVFATLIERKEVREFRACPHLAGKCVPIAFRRISRQPREPSPALTRSVRKSQISHCKRLSSNNLRSQGALRKPCAELNPGDGASVSAPLFQ